MRSAVRRLTGHKVSQTRSNARSFLHHFLTPWGPVYSIEVIIFSMPIYMLLSGAEECEIARNGETMLFALGGLRTKFVAARGGA